MCEFCSYVQSSLFWHSYLTNTIMNGLLIIAFVTVVHKIHKWAQKMLHRARVEIDSFESKDVLHIFALNKKLLWETQRNIISFKAACYSMKYIMYTIYRNPWTYHISSSMHYQCLWLSGMIKSYEFNDKE